MAKVAYMLLFILTLEFKNVVKYSGEKRAKIVFYFGKNGVQKNIFVDYENNIVFINKLFVIFVIFVVKMNI